MYTTFLKKLCGESLLNFPHGADEEHKGTESERVKNVSPSHVHLHSLLFTLRYFRNYVHSYFQKNALICI